MKKAALSLVGLLFFALSNLSAQDVMRREFTYVAAPVDNPLKGLVPYARPAPDRFPHSMEFSYLPLSDLMRGPNAFDWQPLEALLNDISSRRHQAVIRIWLEYPGRKEGIPQYLERDGLKVVEWLNDNTAPFPPTKVRTPDYEDARLREALKTFVAAFGAKYDGDPRLAYVTAGLLGTWGEWHTYPRSKLMASKQVQLEVMQAYEKAFADTPVLLRYPAGEDAWAIASNHDRQFGYHDDSFAWATLDTGNEADNWFFVPALKAAGPAAINKWKTHPIGGEIRPELWGQIFDEQPKHPQAQDFARCVKETHATWLMDTGMFSEKQSARRIKNATSNVQRMGYEFHVLSAELRRLAGGNMELELQIRNTGVAPFYHPWEVQLSFVQEDGAAQIIPTDWSVANLLPGEPPRSWKVELPADQWASSSEGLALRIANPLPNGLPVRFANEYRNDAPQSWWQFSFAGNAPDGR